MYSLIAFRSLSCVVAVFVERTTVDWLEGTVTTALTGVSRVLPPPFVLEGLSKCLVFSITLSNCFFAEGVGLSARPVQIDNAKSTQTLPVVSLIEWFFIYFVLVVIRVLLDRANAPVHGGHRFCL